MTEPVRWARVVIGGEARWAVAEGEELLEVAGSPFERRTAPPGRVLGRVGDVRLLAPARPTKIVCVGRNYVAHAAEHAAEVPKEPLLFLKPPSSVIGPHDAIVVPVLSERVEHEAELALVIGQRCRGVRPEDAWDVVAGITCANDVTARDLQRRDGQWTRGKGFDTFCPLGPWLVAGVEEGAVTGREIVCRVNGEPRQQGNTSEMVFSPSVIVAWAAAVMTLEPGDVLLTGTPAGVGPLVAGDQVEVEISGVGCLSNPVA